MATKLGEIKNAETGETIVEMIGPATAASNGDALSLGLYALSEMIIRGLQPDKDDGGGMGGRFGYGAKFENEVFMMQPDYQDEWTKPNFLHKPSGLTVDWYKWIGRDMEISNPSLTGEEWHQVLMECYESIPQDARAKAEAESKADAEREADPEYQRHRQECFDALWQAMQRIDLEL